MNRIYDYKEFLESNYSLITILAINNELLRNNFNYSQDLELLLNLDKLSILKLDLEILQSVCYIILRDNLE